MNRYPLRYLGLLLTALLLSACMGPKTPQEVTEAFWEAVINDDAADVVEYSTLNDAKSYDRFSKDWTGFQPTWGKLVIDGKKASIDAKFKSTADANMDDRAFTTYLVQRNDTWLVDYERTASEVNGGLFGALFGSLGRMSDDLSRQLESSANDFNDEMERMGKELEAMSDSFSQQAEQEIEKYSKELQKRIEELEESINRALEDKNNNLSDEDREVLKEVSADLNDDRESLDDPSLHSVSQSGLSVGQAQLRLQQISNDVPAEYHEQWQALGEQFEKDMAKMLEALSSSLQGQER